MGPPLDNQSGKGRGKGDVDQCGGQKEEGNTEICMQNANKLNNE